MTKRTTRRIDAALKARIAWEALKETESIAGLADVPCLDAVIVINGVLTAHGAKFLIDRLDVSGRVDRARLQEQRLPGPFELVVEAVHCLAEGWAVDPGGMPVLAAVKRDIDARDRASTGLCDTGQHIVALLLERRLRQRICDHRLAIHNPCEAPRAAIREQISVLRVSSRWCQA
jgi:hypothetical protein